MIPNLLESQYLPSIGWLCLARASGSVRLDAAEHYQKGSLRNKAIVQLAGRPTTMTVPLTKGKHGGVPTRRVQVHQDQDWQTQHLRTIRSSLGKSPYFIHFMDDVADLLHSSYPDLWSLNLSILHWMNETLELDLTFIEQLAFVTPGQPESQLRGAIKFKGGRSPVENQLQSALDTVRPETHLPWKPDVRESSLSLMFYLGRETRLVLDRLNSVSTSISDILNHT